jgi:lipoyl-dependent peroxiredoxin
MPIKKANAEWNGNLAEGKGVVSVESGLFTNSNYTAAKRFGDEKGTNPEELVGAAHAACYSMALSHGLASNGFKPVSVKTEDKVHLEKVGDGFSITKIEVNVEADVPGIDNATFQKFAEDTKKGCPVSKALTGVEFILNAKLK